MNILQILPALNVGGVERGVVDLARYLVAKGHKVVVVSGGGKLVKELDAMSARHYKLNVGAKNPFTMVSAVPHLVNIIKRENIDIVHARSRVPAWIAFFACILTNTKFITTAHGYYKNRFTSRVMAWGRYVIVASSVIARHMIDNYGVPFEKIALIPRGVDLNQFKFKMPVENKSGYFTVGMISRISPIKGHTYFIKALSMVSRVMPKLRVLIVGDCAAGKERYKEELELLVRRSGLDRYVEFMGEQHDIPAILSKLDLLVLPTTAPEAFGRVIIEAGACGVPVVATKVGGIVEIIKDKLNGILVQPEDHHALQEAIVRIAKDKKLAQDLAINARKTVEEKFSLEKMVDETLKLYEKTLDTLNILVIKISALGDVVLAIPSLRAIRSKFPKANIKVLVGVKSRQILKNCPYIDGLIVCDLKGKDKGWRNMLKLGTILRKSNFDIVIDFQNNRDSHILSFLSMAPMRYGYKNGKLSFFLNKAVDLPSETLDPVSHQFRVLKKLGIETEDKNLELWVSDEDEEWADKFLEDNWLNRRAHNLVALNLGGSKRWLTKRWPIDSFAKLCDELARRFGIRTLVIGAKEDIDLAQGLKSITKSKPVIAVGKTDLLKLASLLKRCRLLVTSDSAPMHIAACMDVPYIALFGPTDPNRHLPPSEKFTVLKKNIRCSPCYQPRCIRGLKCMKAISVDEVLEAIERYLPAHQSILMAGREKIPRLQSRGATQ